VFDSLRQVRLGERRDTAVAAGSLFFFMAAHALLETTRDALFLTHIDAARLPFVYIGVAAASFVVALIQGRGPSGRRALAAWLLIAGFATLGFWPLVGRGHWVLYALYIWSAIVVTVALIRFFLLLGQRFTVTQAKRLYALIGAGSVAGALAGSAAAGALAVWLPPQHLLLVAAGALLLSSAGPLLLSEAEGDRGAGASPTPDRGMSSPEVLAHPYARGLALLMLLATLLFTLADFVFKSTVAAVVDPDSLASFLARFYFMVNLSSLAVQLVIVRWVIRIAGPVTTASALPALLGVSGFALLAGGGLSAALAMKALDGSLRHSLHRTAVELLFVPLGERLRTGAKTFIDTVAHRGGQALASVAILAMGAAGLGTSHLGLVIVALGLATAIVASRIRRQYLGVFRKTLADAAAHPGHAFPEFDLASLESLLSALSSTDPARVTASLRLLADRERAHLIPTLILYHPSPDVLVEALELLTGSGRTDFLPLSDRLLDHEYAAVRAAALRARIEIAPDEQLLWSKADVSCPVVRATALVGLVTNFVRARELQPELDKIVEDGSPIAREALANAIRYGRPLVFDDHLARLARSDEDDVLVSVVRSMNKTPSPRFLPLLLRLLERRRVRPHVRATLVKMGESALSALDGLLLDEDGPSRLRRQLPRTIAMFDPKRAAPILTQHLEDVADERLRHEILRCLYRITVDHPDLPQDRATLEVILMQLVTNAYRLMDRRLVLQHGAEESATRVTNTHGLLERVLRDNHDSTIDQIFLLLGVLWPSEQLRVIQRGISNERARVRASSRELLESLLPSASRAMILGLLEEIPDAEKLQAVRSSYQREGLGYNELLVELMSRGGQSVRALAVAQIGELELRGYREKVEETQATATGFLDEIVARTLTLLDQVEAGETA
jgi:ATP:ADP antiporter, AAA family